MYTSSYEPCSDDDFRGIKQPGESFPWPTEFFGSYTQDVSLLLLLLTFRISMQGFEYTCQCMLEFLLSGSRFFDAVLCKQILGISTNTPNRSDKHCASKWPL